MPSNLISGIVPVNHYKVDQDQSEWLNQQAIAKATKAANARQVSGRRRFIDPTTCERDYSLDELEFMKAVDQYKKTSGRPFPTLCELLEVVRSLGYQKNHELEPSSV
jgi:hypothetical protein